MGSPAYQTQVGQVRQVLVVQEDQRVLRGALVIQVQVLRALGILFQGALEALRGMPEMPGLEVMEDQQVMEGQNHRNNRDRDRLQLLQVERGVLAAMQRDLAVQEQVIEQNPDQTTVLQEWVEVEVAAQD